jgi:hypothetical protein
VRLMLNVGRKNRCIVELMTKRFLLRDFNDSDAAAFEAYHSNPRSYEFYDAEKTEPGHPAPKARTKRRRSCTGMGHSGRQRMNRLVGINRLAPLVFFHPLKSKTPRALCAWQVVGMTLASCILAMPYTWHCQSYRDGVIATRKYVGNLLQ